MDQGTGAKVTARRLGLSLLCVLMIAMAAHMIVSPSGYAAAGGQEHLRGDGGGGAGAAIGIVLRLAVDAVGIAGTAAGLALVAGAGLAAMWWTPRRAG